VIRIEFLERITRDDDRGERNEMLQLQSAAAAADGIQFSSLLIATFSF
jgi:hypothetical protein